MLPKGFLGAENDRTKGNTWRSAVYGRFQNIEMRMRLVEVRQLLYL